MKKIHIFKKITTFTVICLILAGILIAPAGFSSQDKEYREGQIIFINGNNYLIVSNGLFAEILEITSDDKLKQISEVHGMDQVKDLVAYNDKNSTYLVVATGQYLIQYDISNPFFPRIVLKKDLYKWRRNKVTIGYVDSLAMNDNYIFTSGSKGVWKFSRDTLLDISNYTYERTYGVFASKDKLYFNTKDKGLTYEIESGKFLEVCSLKNLELERRNPLVDYSGNRYFLGDNILLKFNDRSSWGYSNPVSEGKLFSYAASSLPDGQVYYANGYGLSRFDKNFNKLGFFYSAQSHLYGENSWAVGVETANLKQGNRVIVFNKSSILLMDDKMKVINQYKYNSSLGNLASTELKIIPSEYLGSSGSQVLLQLFGFWPNEKVNIDFAGTSYSVTTNNAGYAYTNLIVPNKGIGITIIGAKGEDSGLRYQTTFNIIN